MSKIATMLVMSYDHSSTGTQRSPVPASAVDRDRQGVYAYKRAPHHVQSTAVYLEVRRFPSSRRNRNVRDKQTRPEGDLTDCLQAIDHCRNKVAIAGLGRHVKLDLLFESKTRRGSTPEQRKNKKRTQPGLALPQGPRVCKT